LTWLLVALVAWGVLDILSGGALLIWSVVSLIGAVLSRDPTREPPNHRRRRYWRVGED